MTQTLSGVTVLDLTRDTVGPFAALTLADLGARVIKVERPGTGDPARQTLPVKDGRSAYFAALNHSKSSIALDLRAAADCAILEGLIGRADVLLESFRPGVLERLGYGWSRLHRDHPHLILGSLSAHGQTGPAARRPGCEVTARARSGALADAATGTGGTGMAGALFLAQGVLAALFDRARGGPGRHVDVALLDAQLAVADHAVAWLGAAEGPDLPPAGHPSCAPSGLVEAADGRFALAASNDRLFEKLCMTLSLPLSDDPRFADNPSRCRNARLLTRHIETVTLEKPRAHWIALLEAAGIPVAPVQSRAAVLRDPQLAARNMIVDVLDRNGRQAFKAAGNPIKLSDATDRTARGAAPDLDGNRGEILHWLNGASAAHGK
ncbi:CaiB/BaiF CoA transferase family protein [Roseivivax sp. CAU 1761]